MSEDHINNGEENGGTDSPEVVELRTRLQLLKEIQSVQSQLLPQPSSLLVQGPREHNRSCVQKFRRDRIICHMQISEATEKTWKHTELSLSSTIIKLCSNSDLTLMQI